MVGDETGRVDYEPHFARDANRGRRTEGKKIRHLFTDDGRYFATQHAFKVREEMATCFTKVDTTFTKLDTTLKTAGFEITTLQGHFFCPASTAVLVNQIFIVSSRATLPCFGYFASRN